jgi:hypothetical protein
MPLIEMAMMAAGFAADNFAVMRPAMYRWASGFEVFSQKLQRFDQMGRQFFFGRDGGYIRLAAARLT